MIEFKEANEGLQKRIGCFYVPNEYLQQRADAVLEVFRRLPMVVLNVEHVWQQRRHRYTALCPEFDVREERCSEVPEYDITIAGKQDGSFEITVSKSAQWALPGSDAQDLEIRDLELGGING